MKIFFVSVSVGTVFVFLFFIFIALSLYSFDVLIKNESGAIIHVKAVREVSKYLPWEDLGKSKELKNEEVWYIDDFEFFIAKKNKDYKYELLSRELKSKFFITFYNAKSLKLFGMQYWGNTVNMSETYQHIYKILPYDKDVGVEIAIKAHKGNAKKLSYRRQFKSKVSLKIVKDYYEK